MKLYGYWRSSAAFRLRIALNLKGITYESIPINIAPAASEQLSERFMALNPQGRVPAIETERGVLNQSMAVLEWLEETYPDPALLPQDTWQRAHVRAFADVIACDIHPLNNLSVLRKLGAEFDADQDQVNRWYADWIVTGFTALEETLDRAGWSGPLAFGDVPTFADICLVPQMWNARRFNVDLSAFPKLVSIDGYCQALPAFHDAAPEQQSDAVQ